MADRQQRMSTQSVSWEVEETDDPISGRITQVDESTIKLPGGTTIEYGAVSLRGYYPDDPEKANQDSHVCIADFNAAAKHGANGGGEPLLKRSFFGVFDGHGACGDHVSRFVRDTLPGQLLKALRECDGDVGRAYREAFLRTDKLTDLKREIKDEMSGTTAVVVMIEDDMMYIANVGDSRIIIGQRKGARATPRRARRVHSSPLRTPSGHLG